MNSVLKNEAVEYSCGLGVRSACTDNFRMSIKVEKHKYEEAVGWLRDLIYGVRLDKAKMCVICRLVKLS